MELGKSQGDSLWDYESGLCGGSVSAIRSGPCIGEVAQLRGMHSSPSE
jgi:hypothetical protein